MILTKVVLATESKRSLDRIKRVLGDKSYQSVLEKSTKRVNVLAQLALDAYKSKVPVESKDLRDTNLKVKLATAQSGVAEVYISGSHKTHQPAMAARFGTETQSEILAQLLDIGTSSDGHEFRRTRDSISTGVFSSIGRKTPTAGWIAAARRAFAQARRKA